MAKRGQIKRSRREKREVIERPERYRKYQQFFLIVCEDEKTEPAYFEKFKALFPAYTLYLETVGTGRDPLGVIKAAIAERHRLKAFSKREIDFVWAVFDKDDADENETKIAKFEEAFILGKNENINIAFSNEVFELWLLLHLIDVSPATSIPRKKVYHMLQTAVRQKGGEYENFEYIHGNISIIEILSKMGDEEKAIKRAELLLEFHDMKKPIESNPSTHIHKLVKELRAWIRYYNWTP